MRFPALLACTALAVARDARAQDAWAHADTAIVRLPPSAFATLPAEIRTDLDRRGCRIPQTTEDSKPHNVISGDFRGQGANGWAVLCSINRISRVLVYEARATTAVDSVDVRPDKSYLQQGSGGRIVFSRMITTVTPVRVQRALARQKPNTLKASHDGIEIAFVDKASFIVYWTGKGWMEVSASD